jgi:hypothetical protein
MPHALPGSLRRPLKQQVAFSGDRATHGAACHGCLLIAETSCEMRNLFLDRNLLVPTMATDGASFFALPRG